MTGEDMRLTLKRLGWTQTHAAMRLGVTKPERVSEWCSGGRKIPPYIAVSLRNLERLEFATDLTPAGNREPVDAGKPHPKGTGPLVVTLGSLREDGHKLRPHAFMQHRGTDRHKVWHAVCECGWTSARCSRRRDLDTMHVAHLRQIIADWNAAQKERA